MLYAPPAFWQELLHTAYTDTVIGTVRVISWPMQVKQEQLLQIFISFQVVCKPLSC